MYDFLNDVSVDEAVAINKESKKSGYDADNRFFKPNIKNAAKEYQARIRQMPRGVIGLKNKLPVSIEQHYHYIKEPKYGLTLVVKCRKTLGGKEHCPICEANWAMYNTGLKDMRDKAYARRNVVSHISNFLIRDDITTPSNTGRVMLWSHTDKMHRTLIEPTLAEDSDVTKQSGFKKKKERFVPYNIRNGRDFFAIVTENPENKFPSYDASYWDEDGLTPLANSDEEMVSLLEQCYDFNEFLEDVESSEEIAKKYTIFNQQLEEKANAQIFSGSTTNTTMYTPSNTTTAFAQPSSNVQQEAAKSFFKKDDGVNKPITQPVQQPKPIIAEESILASDDGDDDELPF